MGLWPVAGGNRARLRSAVERWQAGIRCFFFWLGLDVGGGGRCVDAQIALESRDDEGVPTIEVVEVDDLVDGVGVVGLLA